MKECKDCEFFNGYDYDDGTPLCEYDGGYENCPYNDEGKTINNGMKIEIDTGFMHDYIKHTLKNAIEGKAVSIAQGEIKNLITDELREKVIEEIERQLKDVVSSAIADFMGKDITIGGGWAEPERTLTREQYLAETIEKELSLKFKSDTLRDYAKRETEKAINTYDKALRDDINKGIRNYFDAATREVLTQNIVSMLMDNDTYQKLSNSMNTFLPQNKE